MMGSDVTPQSDGASLPPDLKADLYESEAAELQAICDYAADRLTDLRPSISEQIEPRPGEDIIEVIEHGSYTLVRKRQPCADGCEDCLHGPYLYRGRRETRPNGTTKVHWSYLGPVDVQGEGD